MESFQTTDSQSSLHSALAHHWESTLLLQAVEMTNSEVRKEASMCGKYFSWKMWFHYNKTNLAGKYSVL